jgi:hypothetical protein
VKSKGKSTRVRNLVVCFLLCLLSLSLSGCTVNEPTAVQNGNANTQGAKPSPPVVASHGNKPQPQGNTPNTGGRMSGTPIDTSKFDADIKQAEEKYNKNKNDNAAKMALAKAYLDRADALTEAAQYNSALGDYRRTLKYDPNNQDAKDWIKKIVEIYEGMGREVPKEGEERPPLPYEKK